MKKIDNYSYEELKMLFYKYGEEKKSPFIAKEIVNEREKKAITTTKELVDMSKYTLNSDNILVSNNVFEGESL